jgi:23S rRNA (adenine2030-N6)-methyltransferase
MLAYRHAFHAGNHADVLKHLVLVRVLRYMALKDKPFTLIDTHAGAGGYSLEGRYANKRAEYADGIARLWAAGEAALPPALADYLELVRRFNGGGDLEQYPGSPAFANLLLRPQDRMRLFELHPTDHRILAAFLGTRPNTQVLQSDGFAAIRSELPPPAGARRAVLLVDPSYELKTDYAKVVGTLREALTRFADTVVMIWYPQLRTVESVQLPHRLQSAADALAKKGWLHVRLSVQQADARGFGLEGSGVFVANPPHVLHGELAPLLQPLVDLLGQYAGANFLLEQWGV